MRLSTCAVLASIIAGCAPSVVLGPSTDGGGDASTGAETSASDVGSSRDVPSPVDAPTPIDVPARIDVRPTDDLARVDVVDAGVMADAGDAPSAEVCPGVDLMRDPSNCGGCGVRCCGGWCFNGTCGTEGPPGTIGCDIPMAGCVGPSPVNSASDPAHCGGCNIRCGAGQYCRQGECVTPDSGVRDVQATDSGPSSDVQECLPGSGASCGAGSSCLCCPAGGPRSHCLCTTTCRSSADCRDPSLPTCSVNPFGSPSGLCMPDALRCAWGAVCAAADTPIATPSGERPIAEIRVGDVVYGRRDGALAPVRVVRVSQTRVYQHTLVRVTLRNGRTVSMSAGHPTAEGLRFADLHEGAMLGGAEVVAREVVPYDGAATHDLLTDGDEGAYVAAGVLVGSTLRESPRPLTPDRRLGPSGW